ncbi:hypothetical protein ACFYST_06070 [Kitasatospora sp. NPDC004614]|uniref:hypothetical protein n=1 Tax=unclassified Kitasatospora TaxID=2633591 RepID=UPI0036CC9D73
MQVSTVRKALAAAARTVVLPSGVPSLTCTGFVPDSVTEPHFFVGEVAVTYDTAMNRRQDELEITCRVLVGRQDDEASQLVLDALLSGAGPASLKAAIEAARGAPGEPALGGLADDFRLERVQGYRWYEHAGIQYVGAELIIHVWGDGRI